MDELLMQALETRFFAPKKEKAYGSEREYIQDLMSLLSLYLVSAAAVKTGCAQAATAEEYSPNLPGTGMSEQEAFAYLSDYPSSQPLPDSEMQELFVAARSHVNSRVQASQQAGILLRIQRVKELLKLSDFAFFALVCALSATLDRGFERLFAALEGDTQRPFPTLGAIQACYGIAHPDEPAQWIELTDASSLASRLLFQPSSEPSLPLLMPVSLRPAILGYLLGQPYQSRQLAACCTEINASVGEKAYFIEQQLHQAGMVVEKMRAGKASHLCVLCGAAGSGKKLTLKKLAAERGAKFLLIQLEQFSTPQEEIVDEILAAALLGGYIPCFVQDEAEIPPQLFGILRVLTAFSIGAFLLTTSEHNPAIPQNYLVTRIHFPIPTLAQRVHIWREFAADYAADASLDWAMIAAKYVLTPGRIRAALRTATQMAEEEAVPIYRQHIGDAVLLGNTGRLSKIADPIETFYKWDDLVLSDAAKGLLRDACNRIKYRHLVETDWGFGGKSAYGNGVSILLYGPPGTGKTMSAQVIAGELGLPLYRINLAQTISKYIGETAKNLDTIFTEARSTNVILFFDEADALFSKRTDVKNSNDRHANSESSYLLQKIEEYSGISILATNLANNFDEAFRRRIGYMVNIHMPTATQRLLLWQNSFPQNAPLSKDVDLTLFADNLEFSGSVIKSAALQSAYFAAGENAEIGMIHIAKAAKRELQKLGKSEPHFLQLYSNN